MDGRGWVGWCLVDGVSPRSALNILISGPKQSAAAPLTACFLPAGGPLPSRSRISSWYTSSMEACLVAEQRGVGGQLEGAHGLC